MTTIKYLLYALLLCVLGILLLGLSADLTAWFSDGEDVTQSVAAGTRALPVVNLISPNGGDTCHIGDVCPIRWEAKDPEDANLDAAIYVSADGGGTWETIAEYIPSVGQYNWVPQNPAGDTYRIKVRVIASHDPWQVWADDASDANFILEELLPAPTVQPTLLDAPGIGGGE